MTKPCKCNNDFFPFRDLNYIIVFPEYQGKPHTFLIRQLLPASVYVSTDQLDDLKRFEKVTKPECQSKKAQISHIVSISSLLR